jgi:thioredoxin-dependent peroxiredoxin
VTFTIFNIEISIWMLLFVAWGLPLTYYRSKFRKIVYQTSHWSINIKPVFVKEIRALAGNIFPGNRDYIRQRNFYRTYLFVYLILFILYLNF